MRSFISSEATVSSQALSTVLVSRTMMPTLEVQNYEDFSAPTFTTTEESAACGDEPHLIKKFVVEVHGVPLTQAPVREVEHCPGCLTHQEAEVAAPIVNQAVEVPTAEYTWNTVPQATQPVQVVMERTQQQPTYFIEKVAQPTILPVPERISQEKIVQPAFSVDRFVAGILGGSVSEVPVVTQTVQTVPQTSQVVYTSVEEPVKTQVATSTARQIPVTLTMPMSAIAQVTRPFVNAFQTAYQPTAFQQVYQQNVVGQGSAPASHENVMERLRSILNFTSGTSTAESRPLTFRQYLEADFQSPALIEERKFIVENLNALRSQFLRDIQPSVKNLPDMAALVNDEAFYQWMLGSQITPAIKQSISAAAEINQFNIISQVADKLMTRSRTDTVETEAADFDEDEDITEEGDYDFDMADLDEEDFDNEVTASELTNVFESRLLSASPTI